MAYMALYRKWRPMTFDEVVEQQPIVTVLRNAVISGRIAHAYLFCGTRGTGKTTMAKIFARAVNCLNPQNGNPCNECDVCRNILTQQILDVSEIDAASNNGVDNIRSIIEDTAYAASVARYKVFIIDEVHMLSPGAFNALLKTLEEPPQDVLFILATTEPNKLPVTILSRCQRYDFKRISQEGIIGRLEKICKEQGISYERPALAFLAEKSDGALRDAISLLDQTLASCSDRLTLAAARAATGSVDKEFLETFASNMIHSEGAELLKQISVLFSEGRDPSDFIGELMQIFRNVLVLLSVKDSEGLLYETKESLERLREMALAVNAQELSLMIRELSRLDSSLKWAVQRKILFEAGILSLCDRKWDASEASLAERVAVLEKRLSDFAALDSPRRSQTPERSQVREEAPPQPAIPEKPAERTEKMEPRQTAAPVPNRTEPQPASAAPAAVRDSDESDWKEFLANISSRGQASLSALVKINSKGVLDGKGNLILVFASPIVKDMILKKDATEILSESATAAYGMPLRVVYATKNDKLDGFSSPQMQAPAQQSAAAEQSGDAFGDAVSMLRELSKQEGFRVEVK